MKDAPFERRSDRSLPITRRKLLFGSVGVSCEAMLASVFRCSAAVAVASMVVSGLTEPAAVLASVPTFTSTASAPPNAVAPGTTIQISATFISQTPSSVSLDIEVLDSSNSRAFQQTFTGQAFVSGQSRTYTATWSIPSTQHSGTYTVKTGAFSSDWLTGYGSNDSAAQIKIGSLTFSMSATPSTTQVSPGGNLSIVGRFTPSLNATNLTADIEVLDSANRRVFEQLFLNQNFTAGQITTLTANWSPPRTLPRGTYTVKMGVFSSDNSVSYGRNNSAASIRAADSSTASYPSRVIGTRPESLLGYWPLDDAAGTVVRELTGKSGNVCPNPGFEVAGAGGADLWDTWLEYGGNGGAVTDELLVVNAGGSKHAAKVTTGADNWSTYVMWEPSGATALTAGTYTLRFWTRGDGSHAGRVRVRDVTHNVDLLPPVSTGLTAAAFGQVSFTFSTPNGCTDAQIIFYGPEGTSSFAYFDDVEVIQQNPLNANLVGTGTVFGAAGPDSTSCSMQFDGNAYIDLPWPVINALSAAGSTTLIDSGSISIWLAFSEADVWSQPDDRANDKHIWMVSSSDYFAANGMFAYKCGGEYFLNNPVSLTNAVNYQRHTSDLTATGTGWLNMTLTWCLSQGRINCYIDGVPDQPQTWPGGSTPLPWSNPPRQVQLGAKMGSARMKGCLADFAMWSAELSPSEVALVGQRSQTVSDRRVIHNQSAR
jgi:hypothetical protein